MIHENIDVSILNRMHRYEDAIHHKLMKEIGLSSALSFYLLVISEQPTGITLSELTAYFDNDKANTTRAVSTLLFKGLVQKADMSIRKYRVRATEKGKALAQKAKESFANLRDMLLAPLSAEERAALLNVFDKILTATPFGW